MSDYILQNYPENTSEENENPPVSGSGLISSGLIISGLIDSGLIPSGLIPSGLIPSNDEGDTSGGGGGGTSGGGGGTSSGGGGGTSGNGGGTSGNGGGTSSGGGGTSGGGGGTSGGGGGTSGGGTTSAIVPNAGEGMSYYTYTFQEVDALIDAGKWPGGYVRGVGYVMALVTKTAARSTIIPQSAQEAFNRALTFEGTPYSWGKVSKDGIDCSGLISAAYGITPKWGTGCGAPPGLTEVTLHSSGSSIINELQLGDVLVWRYRNSKNEMTGHTVLYVNGTRIFHAHGKKGTPTGYTNDLVSYWISTFGTPKVYRKY